VGNAGLKEARGIEKIQLGPWIAEERLRDELAAREAEDVPVAGVAGRDPDAILSWERADEWIFIRCPAPDSGPPGLDRRLEADELPRE
jgi:hypothetical protein